MFSQGRFITDCKRKQRQVRCKCFWKPCMNILVLAVCLCPALFRGCSHRAAVSIRKVRNNGSTWNCIGAVTNHGISFPSTCLRSVSQNCSWGKTCCPILYNEIQFHFENCSILGSLEKEGFLLHACNSWVFFPKLPWDIENGTECVWTGKSYVCR